MILPAITAILGVTIALVGLYFSIKTGKEKPQYSRLMDEFKGQQIIYQTLIGKNELKLLFGFEDKDGKITKREISLDNMKKDFKGDISDIEINFDNNTIYYPISNELEIKDENIVWNKKYLKKKSKLLSNVLVETTIIKNEYLKEALIYLIKRDDGTYETLKLLLNDFEIEENKNYQEARVDCEKKMIYLPYKEKDVN